MDIKETGKREGRERMGKEERKMENARKEEGESLLEWFQITLEFRLT